MSAWNENPVVVTCAITGADVFRENNPNTQIKPTHIKQKS